MQLLREIEISEKVATSDVSWRMKYSVVFQRHNECIGPLLRKHGLDLEWTDPDGTYEEDVVAYIDALSKLKEELMKLPAGCFDFIYYVGLREEAK